ncbi:MAG: hypothetical protein AB7I08_12325 [Thermoleophilia bacterium]
MAEIPYSPDAGDIIRALVEATDVGGRDLPGFVEVYEDGPDVRIRWTYADGAAFVRTGHGLAFDDHEGLVHTHEPPREGVVVGYLDGHPVHEYPAPRAAVLTLPAAARQPPHTPPPSPPGTTGPPAP